MESKEKRAIKERKDEQRKHVYHYMEKEKVTTYSATHKPNYKGRSR